MVTKNLEGPRVRAREETGPIRNPTISSTLASFSTSEPWTAAQELLGKLLTAVGADGALYQRYVESADGPRHAGIAVSDDRLAPLGWLEGLPLPGGVRSLDPRYACEGTRNRFRVWSKRDRSELGAAPPFDPRTRLEANPCGVARLCAFDGDRHVGLVAVVRFESRFDPPELFRLERFEEPVREALIRLDELAEAFRLPSHVVLDREGALLHADVPVPGPLVAWLALAAVRADPVQHVWGYEARFTPLDGPSGPAQLVRFSRLPALRLDRLDSLTDRQRAVAKAAANGASLGQIADALGLSPNTVKTHLQRVYRALGVGSREELARAVRAPPQLRVIDGDRLDAAPEDG